MSRSSSNDGATFCRKTRGSIEGISRVGIRMRIGESVWPRGWLPTVSKKYPPITKSINLIISDVVRMSRIKQRQIIQVLPKLQRGRLLRRKIRAKITRIDSQLCMAGARTALMLTIILPTYITRSIVIPHCIEISQYLPTTLLNRYRKLRRRSPFQPRRTSNRNHFSTPRPNTARIGSKPSTNIVQEAGEKIYSLESILSST